MTLLLLALLAGLWAVVFTPALLRARRSHSPIATVGMFNRSLQALSTTEEISRQYVMGPSRKKMIQRRKRLFESLLAACAVTLFAGLIPSLRVMLWLNLAGDLMLAAFIYFLLNDKNNRPAQTAEPAEQETDGYFDELYLRAGQF